MRLKYGNYQGGDLEDNKGRDKSLDEAHNEGRDYGFDQGRY